MSTLYLLALSGVALIIVAGLYEAVVAVTRRPDWKSGALAPRLSMVTTVDRRSNELPFVGTERRQAEATAAPALVEEKGRKAA